MGSFSHNGGGHALQYSCAGQSIWKVAQLPNHLDRYRDTTPARGVESFTLIASGQADMQKRNAGWNVSLFFICSKLGLICFE